MQISKIGCKSANYQMQVQIAPMPKYKSGVQYKKLSDDFFPDPPLVKKAGKRRDCWGIKSGSGEDGAVSGEFFMKRTDINIKHFFLE